LRHWVEADNSSRQWTAGSLLEHDSMNAPSLGADGDSQQDKDAMHVALFTAMTDWVAGTWRTFSVQLSA
jgi:hypothetical protein